MSTRSSPDSNHGEPEKISNRLSICGVEIEDESNEAEQLDSNNDGEYGNFEANIGQSKRRHRKALDIKNNGLSTDGLQVMLDRYATNVDFIESIQTGATRNRSLIAELRGQTASQIYTRCSKRDSFTETHVGDDIMATFSTIRDYRAACDMQRMDPERFQQVFDLFAEWDEQQYEEFKRNYTLEYVFRRILQQDVRYRTRYMRLLQQCQESTDYSNIDRPLLPLPTPKFLTGDNQLEFCNSSLRSKLRNMRKRGAVERSPESDAFLTRLDDAVCSFFRKLDFIEEVNRPKNRNTHSVDDVVKGLYGRQSKIPVDESFMTNEQSNLGRKRPSATLLSRSLIEKPNKRMATMATRSTSNSRSAAPVNTLARAVLRKAFRARSMIESCRVHSSKPIEANNYGESSSIFSDPLDAYANGNEAANEFDYSSGTVSPFELVKSTDYAKQAEASRGHSSFISKSFSSSSSSTAINKVGILLVDDADNSDGAIDQSNGVHHLDNESNTEPSQQISNDCYIGDQLPVTCVPLLGVGADEPIDEYDLRSILNDLCGMHAVVTCEDFGRVIEHGSVQHPQWGTILVRRSRVVRLGSAQSGFQAPDPQIEFHFPMEQLADFVPPEKIRFDDERNLYLNGILTDFYFLQP